MQEFKNYEESIAKLWDEKFVVKQLKCGEGIATAFCPHCGGTE